MIIQSHAQLFPCPFCGDDAYLTVTCKLHDVVTNRYAVNCGTCLGSTGTSTDKDHVIQSWNKRFMAQDHVRKKPDKHVHTRAIMMAALISSSKSAVDFGSIRTLADNILDAAEHE